MEKKPDVLLENTLLKNYTNKLGGGRGCRRYRKNFCTYLLPKFQNKQTAEKKGPGR